MHRATAARAYDAASACSTSDTRATFVIFRMASFCGPVPEKHEQVEELAS
jgi:hypothetical protein